MSSPSATLASLNLPIPLEAGTLYISVNNAATGQQSLVPVTVDPANQSLQDIATEITAATSNQVQASVNNFTGTLQLQAQSGYTFDFAGELYPPPRLRKT